MRARGVTHKLKMLSLDCMVEQIPDPNSRLYLGSNLDRLRVPIPILDWKVSIQEKQTAAALARITAEEFERLGLTKPETARCIANLDLDNISFIDAAHPCGTTRMSGNARSGVVDENCKVHGIDSIFVAGSSVFPTSGRANPTLMIVILAIRLADWLKHKYFRSSNSYQIDV
jgi:choline dehydrogenase-like flavoprotein